MSKLIPKYQHPFGRIDKLDSIELQDILKGKNWDQYFKPYTDENGNYIFSNIIKQEVPFVGGTYNNSTGTYSFNNYGLTQKQVQQLKESSLAYGYTTNKMGFGNSSNSTFDPELGNQYLKGLQTNIQGFPKDGINNTLSSFVEAPKKYTVATNTDRRINGLNGAYSSFARMAVPHYFFYNKDGEKIYVGYDSKSIGNFNIKPNQKYEYKKIEEVFPEWGNNDKYRGLDIYDVELIGPNPNLSPNDNIPAIPSSGTPERDKPDQNYIDSLKGEFEPKVQEQTSPIDAESPLYKWAKGYGLDPTDPKTKELYERNNKQKNTPQIDPYVLKGLRVFIDNQFNTLNTENLIKNLDITLKSGTPIGRQVHGDYIAQQQAQREAARLINRSPLTSNAQIQSAVDLEAIQKGNQIIEGGNQRDAQVYWNTAEAAWQQAKENTLKADDYANFNRAALAEFNNKIAQMRWDTNRQNMQNWDTFAAEKEQELAQRRQYEQYRDLQRGEAYEDWYNDNYGVDLAKQYELLQKYRNAETKEERDAAEVELQELNRRISLQRQYNRFKQYGWDTSILENNWKTKYKFDNGIVTPLKLGGRLFQKGGGFGVQYTSSGSFSPYELLLKGTRSSSGFTSGSSEKKSSSSEDDKEEKEITQLRKNIAETIKGIDGLDSDVNILSKELIDFFDYTKYSLDDDPTVFYSMYVKALTRVNQVKQSAKQFDQSFKELEKNNALNTPAVTSNGGVIVGVGGTAEMEVVSVNDYLTNTDKYHLLTNGELLELRRKNPNMAFSDKYLTAAAQNGTSLQAIEKYVKDFIGGLGKDEESRDVLTRQFGAQGVQGLQTLQQLIQGGLTNQETAQIAASLNALGEYNVSSSSQINQVKQALASIFSFMPPNMRTLLSLYSGGEENSQKAILGLITKGVSSKIEFKINGFTGLDETGQLKSGSSKSGSGSGSGGSDKDPKESTATRLVLGYGQPSTFQIIAGSNKGWAVSGNTLPITDSSDNSMGRTTMDKLTKAFGGALDLNHAFMGNSRISSLGLSQVLIEDGDITMVALPVDKSSGYNRPAFSRLKALSEAEKQLKSENIDLGLGVNLSSEQKKRVNEIYENNKLSPLFNQDGSINKLDFAYFGLVKGTAKETAFEEDDEFTSRDYLIEATDRERDLFEKTMKAIGDDKKFDISNGYLWGIGRDNVYRGTIFIPLNTNIFNTQSGFGSTYSGTPTQDLTYETLQQKHAAESAQGGVKPLQGKTNFNIQ